MIRQAGFTLVEMVLVLILLSVLSIGLATFIGNATDHYADTAERTRLLGEARLALTRMGREIEGAVPYSLRIREDSGTQCLELLPTRDGGRYQFEGGSGQKPLPVGGKSDSFHALGFEGVGTNNQLTFLQTDPDQVEYVVVYPAPPANSQIYGIGSNNRIDPDDDVALRLFDDDPQLTKDVSSQSGVVSVGLKETASGGGKTRFPRHAPPPRRFFLAGKPVSFCLEENSGGENFDLLRYEDEDYEVQATQPVPPDMSGVTGRPLPLARELAFGSDDDSEFELEPAGFERRGLVRVRLKLEPKSDGGESLTVEHVFQTRNHP